MSLVFEQEYQALYELSAPLMHYAHEYGINLSQDKTELLLKHSALVLEKNKVLNLTRITEPHEVIVKHILDSLLFLIPLQRIIQTTSDTMIKGSNQPDFITSHNDVALSEPLFVNKNLIITNYSNYPFYSQIKADKSSGGSFSKLILKQGIKLIDIGTGAGFPGIPLSIMLGEKTTLIDSVKKKITACNEFIHDLGLVSIQALSDRVEHFTKDHKGQYNIVVARAVAQAGVLLEYAAPLLCNNGIVIISKGNLNSDELLHTFTTAQLCGFQLLDYISIDLPNNSGTRDLITFIKTQPAQVYLPRAVGKAKNEPLYLFHKTK